MRFASKKSEHRRERRAMARPVRLHPPAILDTARMGKLSSDCWIRDYCERVWKLRPASVAG
jgi:glucan phosphorylase